MRKTQDRATELNQRFDEFFSTLPRSQKAVLKAFIISSIVMLSANGLSVFQTSKLLYMMLLLLLFHFVISLSLRHTQTLYYAIFTIVSYKHEELWGEKDYKKFKRCFFLIKMVAVLSLTILFQNITSASTPKSLLLYAMAFGILWVTLTNGFRDACRYQYIDKAIEELINEIDE